MSDTEEVVIKKIPAAKKNTKPEVAREKLKEKRERLKKEKEELIIQEAKKRLIEEAQAEEKRLKEEEEKKKQDPNTQLMEQMKMLMASLAPKPELTIQTPEVKPKKTRAKKSEPVEPEVAIPRVKAVKPKPLPKPRKKYVYLDKPVKVESPSNNFVGNDLFPPQSAEVPSMPPPSVLISYLRNRRDLNTI